LFQVKSITDTNIFCKGLQHPLLATKKVVEGSGCLYLFVGNQTGCLFFQRSPHASKSMASQRAQSVGEALLLKIDAKHRFRLQLILNKRDDDCLDYSMNLEHFHYFENGHYCQLNFGGSHLKTLFVFVVAFCCVLRFHIDQ